MSQTKQERSEFLGLRDPYAETTPGEETSRAPAEPLVTREKLEELARAGAALAVLMLAIAGVIAAVS